MRAILDGPFAHRLPHRVRRFVEHAALASMRFHPEGGSVTVAPGTPTASLVAGGDVALHFSTRDGESSRIDPRVLLEDVLPVFRAADLRFANMESVLTGITRPAAARGAFLRAAPNLAESLAEAGFDAMTCANNHCLDFGAEALAESIEHLNGHGVRTVGVGHTAADARRPVVMTARGVTVGMLGYCDDLNVVPREGGPRPAMVDDEEVVADVRQLRTQVDLVVLQLHWGYEWSMYPLLSHRDRARRFAEAGADVVLCHHAHVPMAVEAWKGRVIAHGLGNFLFGWRPSPAHPWRNRAHLLRVLFNRSGVTSAEIVPCGAAPGHRVVALNGTAGREVLGAHSVLRERLADDAFLARLEEDRVLRETHALFTRLARCVEEDDAADAEQCSRFLGNARQRALRAALSASPREHERELGDLLDRVSEANGAPDDALAIVRHVMTDRVTALTRLLAANARLNAEPLGRVP